jgi:hypothetical protein
MQPYLQPMTFSSQAIWMWGISRKGLVKRECREILVAQLWKENVQYYCEGIEEYYTSSFSRKSRNLNEKALFL